MLISTIRRQYDFIDTHSIIVFAEIAEIAVKY